MTLRPERHSKRRPIKRLWRGRGSVDGSAPHRAPISWPVLRIAHALLLVLTVGLIACLAALATHRERTWPQWVPGQLQWLADGGNWIPVVLVAAVIALLCVVTYRLRRNRSSAAAPVMIVAGLTATTLVLGFTSFWRCTDDHQAGNHPTLITPLLWTVSLVKGGIGDSSLENAGLCPKPMPTALEVARLTIVAAIFISLAGVVAAAFRAQSDRFHAARARAVTVVVDLDDDSASMIDGIARALPPGSALVLMTQSPDKAWIAESRRQGARVVQVNFDRPETLVAHKFWRRLNRLYLLSADPSSNLLRLSIISQRLALTTTKRRVPLIVRIDDPWLAEAWRTQQFGQHGGRSDHLWAADTVSKYEATARRLIDQILEHKTVRRLIICGTSQLTLALCAEMALRHTEQRFHKIEDEPELPALTLVAQDAAEYSSDHAARHKRKGFSSSPPPVDEVSAVPTAAEVSRLIRQSEGEDASTAVIVVDSTAIADPILGTRLAASHPTVPIYVWDPAARLNAERIPVAGELRTYRLGMELPDGHAHDNFERTAMLIHERFSSNADRTKPAALPWELLNDFYKGSNRRQLENALWMVEKVAGHTWATGEASNERVSPESLEKLDALPAGDATPSDDPAAVAVKKLDQLDPDGFTEEAAYRMAQDEWEKWSDYLRARGWTWGSERDTKNKRHERLVDSWKATLDDPALKAVALKSLADTQIALKKLERMGFSNDTAYAMAKAEWESWSRYLRRNGWTLGDKRDEPNKKNEKLVDSWEATVIDPELKAAALRSLAGTLTELLKLGYRSRPMWKTYQRVGTVTAKHRRRRWVWTTASGKTAHASAGDWEVSDGGQPWPVHHHTFRATHRRQQGTTWERTGTVLARPARPGETIDTLEGPVTAADGDWVIQGKRGEQWPVPNDEFRRRYRGPVPVYGSEEVSTAEPEPATV
jgi:hypothetical protein